MDDNFILEYAVSDKTEGNAWERMCWFVHGVVVTCTYDTQEEKVLEALSLKEADFKVATGEKSMPARYRSAKSVVMGAVKYNVEFYDVKEMKAVPKTSLSLFVKSAKESEKATNWEQKIHLRVRQLLRDVSRATDSGEDGAFILRKELQDAGYL